MGIGITPTQERAVDPFASYTSNIVNRLTNMITRGNRGLPTIYDLQVTIDSTSPTDTVVISSGWCFKDDVLIEIQEESTMKILGSSDVSDNYAHNFNYLSASNGYYYIVLYYNYVKSRSAPTARLYCIEATNTGTIYPDNTGDYLLLKVVHVVGGVITGISDYDPGTPANVREYLPIIIGVLPSEPSFDVNSHTGRIIYDIATDTMKYGAAAAWKVVGTGTANKVTANITAPGDWNLSGGFYYDDIDVSALGIGDRFASVTCKNNSTHELVIPWRAGLTTASNCRIWMPVNTVSLGVTIIA
jgi:hypothetical protein